MRFLRRQTAWVAFPIVLAAAFAWHFFGRSENVPIPVPCEDVVAGCSLPQAGLQVRFDQRPAPLRAFKLYVQLANAHEVHASFNMRGMDMGFNRYRLLPADDGRWQGSVMLPACVQGRNDWQMIVDVDGTHYEVPFASD